MKFEDRLLDELRTVVRTRGEEHVNTGRHTARAPRMALAGGVTATVIGIVGAVTLAGIGPGASPAWSVEEEDGLVKVRIDKWEDLDGLERELGKYASHALVQVAPVGKTCSPSWEDSLQPARERAWGVEAHAPGDDEDDSGLLYIKFDPDAVPEGGTLVAYHDEVPDSGSLANERLMVGEGEVESCELVSSGD